MRSKPATPNRSLQCERLEDRRLLAVVVVDTELDIVDFNDDRTSLREAVFATNVLSGADEIRFQLGHDGPVIIALTQGELKIWDSLSIIGPDDGRVTIDGQQQSRLFNIEAGDVVFRQFSLANGRMTGDNLLSQEISNQIYGGGALRSVTQGTLSLQQVDVRGSSTTGANAFGGAIFASGPLFVSNCVINGNVASGDNARGGGIAAFGPAAIVQTTVSGNRASRGGGIDIGGNGSLLVDQSTFNGNRAVNPQNAMGGGIYSGGQLIVRNSTISTNSAQGTFGAQGGGIWVGSSAMIAHTTIVANTASTAAMGGVGIGGGVFAAPSGTSLAVSHSIIASNFSTEGGAELSVGEGSLQVRYSLIADNDGTSLAEAPIGWSDANGNLIGGPEYGYIDPLLDGLKDNGGPTRTHALLAGSPAIFAGDITLTPGVGSTPEFDQRGAPYGRRVGTRIDLGAVEFSHPSLIVDSLSDESDGNYGAGELSLREAIELANQQPGRDSIEFATSLFADGLATIMLTHGELRILDALSIYGPGSKHLTIDATPNDPTPERDDGFGSRVMSASAEVSLVGVMLTGGDVHVRGGGGISSTSPLALLDVAVVGNSSWAAGGGVAAPQLTMIASIIANNRSQIGGAGISIDGSLNRGNSSMYIERSEITGNSAWGNVAIGGIYVRGIIPGVTEVIVRNSVIARNATISGTGGIRVERADVALINTVVADNSGTVHSGLNVSNGGEIFVLNSSIVRNTGGGLLAGAERSTYVEDSTISGNVARANGAGILSTGQLIVRRTTVTGNRSVSPAPNGSTDVDGGGIVVQRGLVLENSIVAGNVGTNAPDILVLRGGSVAAKYSLIGDRRGTALVESGPSSPDDKGNRIGGPGAGIVDPILGPLVDNGGPSLPSPGWFLTHLPLPGSPVINAGDTDSIPGDSLTQEFDQRGAPYARVVGGRMDMGATERQSVSSYANADFNGDGVVDGNDFLVWQRGYGRSDASLSDGDAMGDGKVDGNDLAVWKNQFGDAASPPAAVAPLQWTELAVTVADEAARSVVAVASNSAEQLNQFRALDLPFLSPEQHETSAWSALTSKKRPIQVRIAEIATVGQRHANDPCDIERAVSAWTRRAIQASLAEIDMAHANWEECECDGSVELARAATLRGRI